MNFEIEHTFKSDFLIKNFNFMDNKPQEIFIPKDIELPLRKEKLKKIKGLNLT